MRLTRSLSMAMVLAALVLGACGKRGDPLTPSESAERQKQEQAAE